MEWINIKDARPEHNEQVLVCQDEFYYVAQFSRRMSLKEDDAKFSWFDRNGRRDTMMAFLKGNLFWARLVPPGKE